jgi:CHAT domain-containing protein
LIAGVYYEVDAEIARQARDSLPALAQTLEDAGRIDAALAAELTYAERIDDLAERAAALAALAQRAEQLGRPGLAGEAQISRADLLLSTGAASDAVVTCLDAATTLFLAVDHTHGHIDVQRVKARLAIEREFASTQLLEACLSAYNHADYPRGALSVLMDLSQLAHQRGDTATAATYRRQSLTLAEEVGMGLVRDNFELAQADLLMRNGDYGAAIELCQAALATERSPFMAAGFEQLLASIYSFVNDTSAALRHGHIAMRAYEAIGAIDSASDAALKLASDLGSERRDDAWNEAEALLNDWLVRDEQRGDIDAAINKYELLAQTAINRFIFSPQHRADSALLDRAEQMITVAETLAPQLNAQEAALRLGGLSQLRGQICQLGDDEAGVEQAWRDAMAIYERSGLAMQAANCRFIIGVLYLNRANQQLMPNFGEAEQNLRDALAYYDQAAMRTNAADTRFMFARLYANAALSPLVQSDLANELTDAALGHLSDGEADYDAMRRAFTVGTVLDAQRGKQALAEKSRRIYELALEILTLPRYDVAEFWRWAQHAKARALTDVLGAGVVLPIRVMENLATHPDSYAQVLKERELAHRLETASAAERPALRNELAALQKAMSQNPQLVEYLELRAGAPIEYADLSSMIQLGGQDDRSVVYIDWVAIGDRLFLLLARPALPPQLVRLDLSVPQVQAFVADFLGTTSFRMTLRDAPELLDSLTPLVAPLATLTEPEDLFILSPTGPLHAVPLHALKVGGTLLLERNPVVYCPSLTILRHCVMRHTTPKVPRSAALFGDPTDDRPEAAALVAALAQRFATEPLLRNAVTCDAFATAVAGCDIIHFQGHALHDRNDPLASYLKLADGSLTARDVFGLRGLQAELITLAACESAANVIATGDEPLGLIPAFLYAGTSAVVATLWRVQGSAAAQIMEQFYDALTDPTPALNKVQALRQAMLAVRTLPGRAAPYYWAPFVLQGDWH